MVMVTAIRDVVHSGTLNARHSGEWIPSLQMLSVITITILLVICMDIAERLVWSTASVTEGELFQTIFCCSLAAVASNLWIADPPQTCVSHTLYC